MKVLLTITLSLGLIVGAFAQTYISQAKPIDEKEWGYINKKGEFIIAPKYRKCYKFSDGLAAIYEGKRYFFINAEGEELTTEVNSFKLSSVFGFGLQGYADGMVNILVGKKWGYLDKKGKFVIKNQYDKASKFNGGFAVVKKGTTFYIINKKGEEINIEATDAYLVKHFSEGLAPYSTKGKRNGFINTAGNVVIKAQFLSVGYFVNGLAWAKTIDKKVGYINKKGEWIIEPKFLAVKNFDAKSGLARVKNSDGWMYVNKAGKIISVNTQHYGNFSEGLAKGKMDDKFGYYNNEGKWVIEAQFNGARDFKNGFAAVKKEDKWGFINTKGEWLVDPVFGAVKDMELVK